MPTPPSPSNSDASSLAEILAAVEQGESIVHGSPDRQQIFRIFHRTVYTYGEKARRSTNEVRLTPKENPWQKVTFFLLTIRPATHVKQFRDLHGNNVHHFEITENHSRLVIEAQSIVRKTCKVDFEAFPYGSPMDALRECRRIDHCHEFLEPSHFIEVTPDIWRAAVDARGLSEDVFQTAYNIMTFVYKRFGYVPGATHVGTSAMEAFKAKSGVCQDFAHVMIAMCRALGIPARYVSGYLFDPAHDDLRGTQASHAWVEIFVLGRGGWFGLDPTNNKVVDEHYVSVATGRDYNDVSPARGTFFGGGAHRTLDVTVSVDRAE